MKFLNPVLQEWAKSVNCLYLTGHVL